MKNRLITQSTEYDCGPTCVMNALRFLYERHELPPALFKNIWLLCNDTYSTTGELGKHGTSMAVMRYLSYWFNDYGRGCQFPIRAEYQCHDEAVITPGSRVDECLHEGGAAIIRCWSEGIRHYVLLTTPMDGGRIGLFDPYDEPDCEVSAAPGLEIVHDQRDYNLILPMTTLNLNDRTNYALGETPDREILMLWRTPADDQA